MTVTGFNAMSLSELIMIILGVLTLPILGWMIQKLIVLGQIDAAQGVQLGFIEQQIHELRADVDLVKRFACSAADCPMKRWQHEMAEKARADFESKTKNES